jgi:hypothetical protein
VLADPRARRRERRTDMAAKATTMYRLADEPRAVVLVASGKCEWRAAFERSELIAAHRADCPMPSLLLGQVRRLLRRADRRIMKMTGGGKTLRPRTRPP